MTTTTNSDDLLRRLENAGNTLELWGHAATAKNVKIAAAHIRELEVQLAAADEHAKLAEALVEKVVSWDGEPATHVIVPVEPTDEMRAVGGCYFGGALSEESQAHAVRVYAAMISAGI